MSAPASRRLVTLSARRSTLEYVLAEAGAAEPGLQVRRSAPVRKLTVRGDAGVPRVAGVRLDSGEEMAADLVMDAMGRGSRLPRWLAAAGVDPIHEEAEDSGFLYYPLLPLSRREPALFRAPLLSEIGTFSVLTVPADNGVWSVTLYVSAGDQPLKQMRDAAIWDAVLGACPRHAQWRDGRPMTDVLAMGGIVDRYRRLAGPAGPVVTGVALLGDAWACTNPSLGRGMTLGLMHAALLRDVVRSHLDDPLEFATAWDAVTEREMSPWYRETIAQARASARDGGSAHRARARPAGRVGRPPPRGARRRGRRRRRLPRLPGHAELPYARARAVGGPPGHRVHPRRGRRSPRPVGPRS
jgi:2-polyprenyl-6-methoxyphenol hydroxylase-like FAD-dependent oxidoreductase